MTSQMHGGLIEYTMINMGGCGGGSVKAIALLFPTIWELVEC